MFNDNSLYMQLCSHVQSVLGGSSLGIVGVYFKLRDFTLAVKYISSVEACDHWLPKLCYDSGSESYPPSRNAWFLIFMLSALMPFLTFLALSTRDKSNRLLLLKLFFQRSDLQTKEEGRFYR